MKISAVIFDHDGTLVDSEQVHLALWRKVLLPHSLSKADYDTYLLGTPSDKTAAWLIQHFSLDTSIQKLLQKKLEALDLFLQHDAFPLMPGSMALVEYLHQHSMPLAIASGARENEVVRSLQFHKLDQLFTHIATGNMVKHNKPAPDVYQLAADKLSIAPEACLAIEDSDSGQRAARSAGMQCIRLKTTSALTHDPGCIYVNDLNEAFKWIQQNLNQP